MVLGANSFFWRLLKVLVRPLALFWKQKVTLRHQVSPTDNLAGFVVSSKLELIFILAKDVFLDATIFQGLHLDDSSLVRGQVALLLLL